MKKSALPIIIFIFIIQSIHARNNRFLYRENGISVYSLPALQQLCSNKVQHHIAGVDTVGHAVLDSILAINLAGYLNKPVDSLLNALPVSNNIKRVLDGGRTYHAERLLINYSNKYIVYIIVRNFQHMNKFDISRQWNIAQFKQELINWIVVYDAETCIYGCNTANSWD
jgi:hypothetical protein